MSGTLNKETGENNDPNPGGEGQEGQGTNPNPGGEGEGQGQQQGSHESSLDYSNAEVVKAEIERLRKENAKHRLKNKTLGEKLGQFDERFKKVQSSLGLGKEEGEGNPEEHISHLRAQNQALQMELEITGIADEFDIPKGQRKFFKYLLNEAFEELEDGEEISEEKLDEIANQAKLAGGGTKSQSTGINSQSAPKPNTGGQDLTVEKFASLSISAKSKLFNDDPQTYNRLFSVAKEKRLI